MCSRRRARSFLERSGGPDEGVWARVKQEVGKQIVLTNDELLHKTTAALEKLGAMPHAVHAIFRQPDFSYAAE